MPSAPCSPDTDIAIQFPIGNHTPTRSRQHTISKLYHQNHIASLCLNIFPFLIGPVRVHGAYQCHCSKCMVSFFYLYNSHKRTNCLSYSKGELSIDFPPSFSAIMKINFHEKRKVQMYVLCFQEVSEFWSILRGTMASGARNFLLKK